MSTKHRLHHKIERALVAWLEANKGEALAGVTIVTGHTNTLDTPLPYLAVCCMNAKPHPDFAGCGRRFPEQVDALLYFKSNAADQAHEESIAIWLQELSDLVTAPAEGSEADYSKLVADLNPPAAGPDARTIKPLYVTAIHPGDDSGDFDAVDYDEALILEFVAQNGEPPSTGVLMVTPSTSLLSTGAAGGPFTPASKVFTLSNTGEDNLTWSATKTAAWLTLSGSSGTLAPDETTTVTVTINAGAEDLSNGAYLDSVVFANASAALPASITKVIGLVVGAEAGGGVDVNRRLGVALPDSGAATFPITFSTPFDDVPAFFEALLETPTGQPAIGVANVTATADGLAVTFDRALPAAGYKLRYLAIFSE